MTMTATAKSETISTYRKHESDTGSPEVQIALLTSRILELTEHLKENVKDHAARRGLIMMVARRTKLLKYLTKTDFDRYKNIITTLGLRK